MFIMERGRLRADRITIYNMLKVVAILLSNYSLRGLVRMAMRMEVGLG